MTPTERPTLSVAETADLLGISRWLVQQAVRDGSLPSMRVGRRILIPKVQLDALLAGTASARAVGEAADTAVVRLAASQ
jgi:excisionase family DNA binding protein